MAASAMTRHFVLARKRACATATPECFKAIAAVARPLLAMQAHPELADDNWRSANPTMDINYMRDTKMTIDTNDMFNEFDQAYHHASRVCPCWPKMILRSNDGVTAENPDEQHLVGEE